MDLSIHARPARVLTAALSGLLLVLGVSVAVARPTIRTSFFNAYPGAVGSKLDDLPSHADHCGMCHFDFNGAGPRNAYGVRLGQVIGNFANTDAGRQLAMHSIENEDSDSDSYSSLTEITNLTYSNTPTFPGLTPANVGSATNIPNLAELSPYLVPQSGADVTPPVVTVLSPNGGQSWTSGMGQPVTWTATDASGVAAVSVFWRDSDAAVWLPLALNVPNSGSFTWFVPSMPTTTARVRVTATDNAGNTGRDSSDATFTILRAPGGIAPTTLRDFDIPGTQPHGGGSYEGSASCIACHGGYDPAIEPGHGFKGSMMGQASRDPLFLACLAIAEQDAPGSGDLCIRCHMPTGWLQGRSQPTDGSQLIEADMDGVNCDFCHRFVDPIYTAGVDPPEDPAVLAGLLPAHTPTGYGNGQFVMDPLARKRGPFTDTVAPHAVLASAFHRSAEMCGTCHDVSNPVFQRTGPADYAPGPLDAPPAALGSDVLMPLERTYSEWLNSAFPAGVYAPEFAGNLPDGIVRKCQDCHMADVTGRGCNDVAAPIRNDLPHHDMTGGNTWMPGVIGALFPGETDAAALAAASDRARSMLERAAGVDLGAFAEAESLRVLVTVTNRSGHKLPSGYPEGRRMWLEVVARGAGGNVVFHSGAWDPGTGVLAGDPQLTTYEAHLGISPGLGAALGVPHGTSFHFTLNDSVYKDNRIPPQGFTNAAFATFGGAPVDPEHPEISPRYPDGQNWDVADYHLPSTTRSVRVTLWYQTTSNEYVEFLRDENTTNSAGDVMHAAWVAHGRAAPVAMASDSMVVAPVSVEPAAPPRAHLALARNPFRTQLEALLEIESPARVTWSVIDALGRRVAAGDLGTLGAGGHRIVWDGRGRSGSPVGPGLYWLRATVGGRDLVKAAVRVR